MCVDATEQELDIIRGKLMVGAATGDEIRTFLNTKSDATWVFTAIEVWSRLWPVCRVGRRSYRNTHHIVNDVIGRSFFKRCESSFYLVLDNNESVGAQAIFDLFSSLVPISAGTWILLRVESLS